MSNNAALCFTKYFGEYLPRHKGASENTIRSYRDTFVQLIEYMECEHKIQCNKLSIDDLNVRIILEFLKHLETIHHISVSTRNQRLAAIHSFFKYLQRMEPALFNHCREILALEFKKKPEPEIGYLRIDEMKYLLSLPDTTNRHEFRDLAILSTLYETGARVQELIDLRYGDVSLNSCPTILLKGKGGKSRTVPIGKDVATILRNYIINYGVTETGQYIFTNSQGNKLTRVGVQYIIDKYVKRGRILDSSLFHGKITNHSFRHSKSMHLLEAGVNLIYIRDFLGHTSVTTTEIYARANVEIKRKTIEQHGATLATDDKYSRKLKDDLLSWLKTTL